MHAMWMSVTETIKCGGKLIDVWPQQQKPVKRKCNRTSFEKKTHYYEVTPRENPAINSTFQHKYPRRRWFYGKVSKILIIFT